MLNCLRLLGLDIEVIKDLNNDIISTALKAYIDAQIPVIATLRLQGSCREDYHAAVISGYRCDSNRDIKEVYVHDDQIGSYSRVTFINNNLKLWHNEWRELGDYNNVILQELLVPVYPKIRLAFPYIYGEYSRVRSIVEDREPDLDLELKLDFVRRYKEFLTTKQFTNKTEILTGNFPKFIWIIRGYYNGEIGRDYIL